MTLEAEVQRCRAEIGRCETALMNGDTPDETQGILIGLGDWTAELRILERLIRDRNPETSIR